MKKQPIVIGYILFNFSKIGIAVCGATTLVTTYSYLSLDVGMTIIFTIIGVYTILHGILNVGSLRKYKKLL